MVVTGICAVAVGGLLLANVMAQTEPKGTPMDAMPWKKELIDAAVERVIPGFVAGMDAEEAALARQVLSLDFYNNYPEATRSPLGDELLEDRVQERIRQGNHLSLSERRFILRQESVRARVQYDSDFAFRAAEKVLRKVALTEAEREECRRIAESLLQTSRRLKEESPAWYAQLSETISEGLLDAHYALNGGGAMSLRLGHVPLN